MYRAIINLLDNEFIPEAGALVRHLLEVYFDLVLICQCESDKYAKKYANFHMDIAKSLHEAMSEDCIDKLIRQAHWLNCGFKKRIDLIQDLEAKNSIKLFYVYLCQHSHPTYVILSSRFLFIKEDYAPRVEYLKQKKRQMELCASDLICASYSIIAKNYGYDDLLNHVTEIKNKIMPELNR